MNPGKTEIRQEENVKRLLPALLALGLLPVSKSPAAQDPAETLYRSALTAARAGVGHLEAGRLDEAGDEIGKAAYFLQGLRRDFPDWSLPLEDDGRPRSCLWHPFPQVSGEDIEPGNVYSIEVESVGQGTLRLKYRKAAGWEEGAMVSVAIDTGGGYNYLQDERNTGLFRREAGEVILVPHVPPGSEIFLTAPGVDGPPNVLSNVEEIP